MRKPLHEPRAGFELRRLDPAKCLERGRKRRGNGQHEPHAPIAHGALKTVLRRCVERFCLRCGGRFDSYPRRS
jgi:hypothetical protein